MAITKTLGGDRLGGENQMKVHLHNFGRSSHNVGRLVKTDQAAATLVPYHCDLATNGTTYYIDMATKVRTLPTNGPIFGRFKHQIDVFVAPIRLYIAALHNNALGVGLKMQNIKMPMIEVVVPKIDFSKPNPNQQQISQDSLLAYLGIRGLGRVNDVGDMRTLPAFFLLMYWDIYKNYYANKQEEVGYVISGQQNTNSGGNFDQAEDLDPIIVGENMPIGDSNIEWKKPTGDDYYQINVAGVSNLKDVRFARQVGTSLQYYTAIENGWTANRTVGDTYMFTYTEDNIWIFPAGEIPWFTNSESIKLTQFPLSNIDDMREEILAAPKTSPFIINSNTKMPYSATLKDVAGSKTGEIQAKFSQCGLGIKTYLSDRFNNWLSTEWIDGENGINEITSIDVSDGKLSMNDLILQKKIFDMLNRIAISGGSYNDWQEAVYGEKTTRMAESPIYCGGLSSDITFAEVVSSSDTEVNGEQQPLGSLAGRGVDANGKGGRSIKIKVSEPSMIMIIGSITPRIDYSQGNKWWNKIETMDDLHKPNLDGIGFQELPTDEICAWDCLTDSDQNTTYNSAGKQPAWIEYMTNVDEVYGDFSAGESLEYMAMNRAYSHTNTGGIQDLTTYIDPVLYNKAFAQADLTAKNFWIQVGFKITARRKMSAKQIPNL